MCDILCFGMMIVTTACHAGNLIEWLNQQFFLALAHDPGFNGQLMNLFQPQPSNGIFGQMLINML
jgi:hypothetical protein